MIAKELHMTLRAAQDHVAKLGHLLRRFPGHKSYGLGNLCKVYDIALDDHHRALCNARATVHLLNLMNAKRQDSEPVDHIKIDKKSPPNPPKRATILAIG